MLINLIAKWSGFGWIWAKLDGAKAYLTGAAAILTGVSGLITEYLAISGVHNFATLLTFVQGFSKDGNWLTVLSGCAIIAAAHKAEKVIAAVNTPAPIETPSQAAPGPAPAPIIPPAGPDAPKP